LGGEPCREGEEKMRSGKGWEGGQEKNAGSREAEKTLLLERERERREEGPTKERGDNGSRKGERERAGEKFRVERRKKNMRSRQERERREEGPTRERQR
jgi:hypothetical protein